MTDFRSASILESHQRKILIMKRKQRLLLVLPFLMVSVSLFACNNGKSSSEPATSVFVDPTSVSVPNNEFHTDLQYAYFQSSYDMISHFASGSKELSKPKGIPLSWDSIANADVYHVVLSEDATFSTYRDDISIYPTYRLYNLKIDTTYYYKIGVTKEAALAAEAQTFSTASTGLRNLSLDGATNVRDIGGKASTLGGKIAQGLFYRGGKLNAGAENGTPKLLLSKQGITTLSKEWGIKSEIDLRMTSAANSNNEAGTFTGDLIEGIRYHSNPLDWTVKDMMKEQQEQIKGIFSLLSAPANYPVYLHCSLGTDRTGMISYILESLLGMSDEDMYRDYLFSNFGLIGSSRDVSAVKKTYQEDLKAMNGKSLSDDAEKYLLSIGNTKDEISAIRSLFLVK